MQLCISFSGSIRLSWAHLPLSPYLSLDSIAATVDQSCADPWPESQPLRYGSRPIPRVSRRHSHAGVSQRLRASSPFLPLLRHPLRSRYAPHLNPGFWNPNLHSVSLSGTLDVYPEAPVGLLRRETRHGHGGEARLR